MTKENPAGVHATAKFMSELSGISTTYEQRYPTLDSMSYSTKHKPPKRKVIYPASEIKVVTESGEIVDYHSGYHAGNQRFDKLGIVAKEFIVTRRRTLDEFKIEYKSVGKYKDCEGNGWYCMVTLFKITGHEFYFI